MGCVSRRGVLRSALAAAVAVALLCVALQRHHHASLQQDDCIACTMHARAAAPAQAPFALAAPLLFVQSAPKADVAQPRSLVDPVPRAQGPPAA
jgi:hypothetical protein